MFRWKIILPIGLLFISFVLLGFWLKSPYDFAQPNQIAETFVAHLQSGDFQLAHEMTFKNELVGKSPLELRLVTARQLCGHHTKLKRVSTSPLQTNSNRLRRWLKGAEVEIPEIQVEFEDIPCLFKVSLRHTASGQWKVHNFQNHAG